MPLPGGRVNNRRHCLQFFFISPIYPNDKFFFIRQINPIEKKGLMKLKRRDGQTDVLHTLRVNFACRGARSGKSGAEKHQLGRVSARRD